MKKLLFKLVTLLFLTSIFGCSNSDIPDDTSLGLNPISNLKVIPLQLVQLNSNKLFEGSIEDYKLFFDSTEVTISELIDNGMEIIIPLEISQGLYKINLQFKNEDNNWGEIEILNPSDIFPKGIAFRETEDPEYPIIFIDSINNTIVPRLIDGKIKSITLEPLEGISTYIELNEYNLPTYIYNNEITIIADGYDFNNNTVNIAFFYNQDPDNVIFKYGLELDESAFLGVTANKTTILNSIKDPETRNEIIKALGTALSATGCIIGTLTAPTGFGVFLGYVSCGQFAYNLATYANSDLDSNIVNHMSAFFGIKMNLIGCLSAIATRNAYSLINSISDCYGLALQVANGINIAFGDYFNEHENDLQNLRDILSTGFGDVKITLSWDTNETDIDLWVTDPLGNLIKWDQPSSSSGGQLDLDDVNGFGPENIFWPTNKSPFGLYTVQIHYYSPDNGPVTNCTVRVFNFGNQTTYHQTLTPNGLVTITQFEAGNNSSKQNIVKPVVTTFRSSKLKK